MDPASGDETKSDDPALHELAPTSRFTDRAADYVKYRPAYPALAIDAVLEGMGEPSRLVAADVGAGTGIASRQLADRGVRVEAVEPNPAMREAASPHGSVEWSEGSAEATRLPGASVDVVLCAQAFHWFRPHESLAEFHRILRPGGRLALLWNSRDRRDPLMLGYIDAIHAVNGEHPAERREFDPAVLEGEWFTPATLVTFPHAQDLDREGLVGRAVSASFVPKQGAAFLALRERLDALFDRHRDARGRVRMRYVTKLYRAQRR